MSTAPDAPASPPLRATAATATTNTPLPLPNSKSATTTATSMQPTRVLRSHPSLSDQASEIVVDTERLNEALGAVSQKRKPWDKEVESLRQKMRRRYLTLIFTHPKSTGAVIFDQAWVRTTHAFIAQYRALIAGADEAVAAEAQQPAGAGRQARNGGSRRQNGGGGFQSHPPNSSSAELRNTLKSFRSFLAQEIAFYSDMLARMVRKFELEEARPFLEALQIDVAPMAGGSFQGDKGHDKFMLLHKGLVFLGDLERYKEMYSEKERERTRTTLAFAEGKRFERAKQVYDLARLLVPDNGNPFNQLAVIATQCIQDPFAATYLYLRAISLNFDTSRKNLKLTLKKAFNARLKGEPYTNGSSSSTSVVDEAKLKKDVVLLQAVYAFKPNHHLRQSDNVVKNFRILLAERALSSETILHVVVLSIAAYWEARHTRPESRSKSESEDVGLERANLAHVVALLSAMFEVCMIEVREAREAVGGVRPTVHEGSPLDILAFADDDASSSLLAGKGSMPSLDKFSNFLTAVLRRALPAIRVAAKWITADLQWILAASYSSAPDDNAVNIGLLWSTYAGFLNILASTFPISELQRLETSLPEDIELRGFPPLRGSMGSSWSGKDLGEKEREGHPIEIELMRVWDIQAEGRKTALSGKPALCAQAGHFAVYGAANRSPSLRPPASKTSLDAASPVFVPSSAKHSAPPSPKPNTSGTTPISSSKTADSGLFPPLSVPVALPSRVATPIEVTKEEEEQDEQEQLAINSGSLFAADHEHDLASVSTETDDDPVNRAMRAALDDGESISTVSEDDVCPVPSDEDNEERILWPTPRRDTVTASSTRDRLVATPIAHVAPSNNNSVAGLTALDLLQQITSNSPSLATPQSHARDGSPASRSRLLFGTGTGGGSGSKLGSIWGPGPSELPSSASIQRTLSYGAGGEGAWAASPGGQAANSLSLNPARSYNLAVGESSPNGGYGGGSSRFDQYDSPAGRHHLQQPQHQQQAKSPQMPLAPPSYAGDSPFQTGNTFGHRPTDGSRFRPPPQMPQEPARCPAPPHFPPISATSSAPSSAFYGYPPAFGAVSQQQSFGQQAQPFASFQPEPGWTLRHQLQAGGDARSAGEQSLFGSIPYASHQQQQQQQQQLSPSHFGFSNGGGGGSNPWG